MTSSILAMRRRNVWEAADSGILLWRENFRFILLFFALPVGTAAAILYLIPFDYRWLTWLGLWWLKPFFDRLCLQVISARFFRNRPSAQNGASPEDASESGIRRVLRGMAKTIFPFLPGDLLWRRFSPFRCASMPLRLMERLKSKQYAARKNSLVSGGFGFSVFLSCMGPPLEAVLLGGEILFTRVFFHFFLPEYDFSFDAGQDFFALTVFAFYCANYILVESLYVCMGFGVYINSRVETEGWDIELLFRKFSTGIRGGAAVIVATLSLLLLSPLHAETPGEAGTAEFFPSGFMPPQSVPLEELEGILASGEFGGYEPGWTISPKNIKEEKEPPPVVDLAPWLTRLKENLAKGLRAVVIAIFTGAAAFVLVRLYRTRQSRKPAVSAAGTSFANPLVSRGNPEALFDSAEDLFRQGLVADAWAACLRGALNAYTLYLDIPFSPEITEYGCLNEVRNRFGGGETGASLVDGFDALIRNWVFLLYGARTPPPGSFEKALEFGRSLKSKASPPEAVIA